jgi:phenylalanyl-tRNA synthetase beta chain
VRIVFNWLRDIVAVPDDVDTVAREISLRGFELAAVEQGREAVIDFEITANRPDCLSHVGIAREAAAIWGGAIKSGSGTRDAGSERIPDPGSRPSTAQGAPSLSRDTQRHNHSK